MSGYGSKYWRYDCDTDGCYVRSLPSWDDLIECFPRDIRPTDVDGLVEINDNVLLLEQKSSPGKSLDEGQRQALRKLSRRKGITTLCMRPPLRPTLATDVECLIFGNGPSQGWQPHSREWLKDWLRKWVDAAESGSKNDPPLGETG